MHMHTHMHTTHHIGWPRLGDAPLSHEQQVVIVDDGVKPVRDGQYCRGGEAAAQDALDHLDIWGLQPRSHRVAASSTQGRSLGRGSVYLTASVAKSTLAVASSSSSSLEPRSSARASMTSCLVPEERLAPPSATTCSTPSMLPERRGQSTW